MDDLSLYNALLADLNKATSAWLGDLSTVESANSYKAKTLLAAGWTKRPEAAPSTQQPPSEGVPEPEDAEGVAERQVGRYVYRRISKLMDAEPGTPEGEELLFLADIASQVEDYGEEACGDHDLGVPAPAVQEQELDSTALEMAALEIVELYRGDGGFCGLKAAEEQARRTLRAYFAALRTRGGE
jgi:hypothetical protein